MIQTNPNPVLSLSPSFNCYTSSKLSLESVIPPQSNDSDDSNVIPASDQMEPTPGDGGGDDDDDDDFEFAVVRRDSDGSIIPADEIFDDGQIRPTFPFFDRRLLLLADPPDKPAVPARLPLRKLMLEDRDAHSASSSESDELDRLPEGTYCLWKPPTVSSAAASPSRCKKSNSTGSSRRWRFRDLLRRSLRRSRSDGSKETLVIEEREKKEQRNSGDGRGKGKGKERPEMHNRTAKEGDRGRSYLPYKKELMGLFSNGRDLRSS